MRIRNAADDLLTNVLRGLVSESGYGRYKRSLGIYKISAILQWQWTQHDYTDWLMPVGLDSRAMAYILNTKW